MCRFARAFTSTWSKLAPKNAAWFRFLDALGSDVDRKDKTCKEIEGIIKENEKLIKDAKDPEVRDAGIIAGAQRVAHYEISAYGTARTYAWLLGRNDWAQLLQTTLDEEKETDRKLNVLAEAINIEARAA